ncbi:MAG: hypothetical protein RPR97_14970 [Colwellia sp.]
MRRVHIGFNIPSQDDVFVERYYNDEDTTPVKTLITCPNKHWSYSMELLSEEEFELLIDKNHIPDDKKGIYIKYLGSEVVSGFTFF